MSENSQNPIAVRAQALQRMSALSTAGHPQPSHLLLQEIHNHMVYGTDFEDVDRLREAVSLLNEISQCMEEICSSTRKVLSHV
jgi:hypothetical protein